MPHIEKTTRVEVPVAVAYNLWAQFEKFPLFMEGVKEVRRIDDRTLLWRAEIAGKEVEWNAAIVHDKPYERIAWRSTNGARNAGSVTFEPAGVSRTRVTLQLEYDPETMTEKTAGALGIVSTRIEGDLRRFKSFVERSEPPADVRDIPPE
jgi:uncharacterized membrane protein